MSPNNFEILKNTFLEFLHFCIKENISYNYSTLVDDFLINNLSLLSNAKLQDLPPANEFCIVGSEIKSPLTELAAKTFPILYTEIKKILLEAPVPLQRFPEMQSSVEGIFIGLEYSGNNDSSWQTGPSAYALATYNI